MMYSAYKPQPSALVELKAYTARARLTPCDQSPDLHRLRIDACGFQAGQQPLGEKVGAESRNHVHGHTQFRDSHRLVGALASVEHIEAAA